VAYCSKCGEKIPDDAYFCPKCGTKTEKGKASNVSYPSDELRDAFYKVGIELERAFNIAARETHAAFKRADKNMKEKSVVCPNCKTKNPHGSIFCHNCGTKIAPIDESRSST
jgi:uncharacterized membrane protein YvbJ